MPASNGLVDKSAASQWRQLRDKIALAKVEIQRWIDLQNSLYTCVGNLLREVTHKYTEITSKFKVSENQQQSANSSTITVTGASSNTTAANGIQPVGSQINSVMSSIEVNEMLRGFKMIRTLVKNKFRATDSQINKSRNGVIQLDTMSSQIVDYVNAMLRIVTEQSQVHKVEERGNERNILAKSMRECISAIQGWTENYRAITSGQSLSLENQDNKSNLPVAAESAYVLSPSMYHIESSYGSAVQAVSSEVFAQQKASTVDPAKIVVSGSHCWVGDAQRSASEQFVELSLLQSLPVVSILVQGGMVSTTVVEDTTDMSAHAAKVTSSSQILAQEDPMHIPAEAQLPCGLTRAQISQSSTDYDLVQSQTIMAVGDMIDWSVMLKKNPPEKFLKRPPVRFIFDLVKCLGALVYRLLLWLPLV
jgi:hypothetical protein